MPVSHAVTDIIWIPVPAPLSAHNTDRPQPLCISSQRRAESDGWLPAAAGALCLRGLQAGRAMESDSVRRSPALFPLYPELDTSSGNLQGIAAPEMFEKPFPLDVRPPLNLFLRRAATSLTAQYIRAIRSLGSRIGNTPDHPQILTRTLAPTHSGRVWPCVRTCLLTTPHTYMEVFLTFPRRSIHHIRRIFC